MRSGALAWALIAGLASTSAFAQTEPASEVPQRVLDGWTFVPVLAIDGPFVTSHVGSATGMRDVGLTVEGVGRQRERDLGFVGLSQAFEAQAGLWDRLALRASLRGDAILPTSGRSALNVALLGGWTAGLGATLMIVRNGPVQLSLVGEYLYSRDAFVSPRLALRGVVFDEGALFTETTRHDVDAGGSLGVALATWIGLVLEARGENEAVAGFDDTQALRLGGAVGFDFAGAGVPIAATLFWVSRVPLGGDNPVAFDRTFGIGLFYAARSYLDVGVEVLRQEIGREPGSIVRQNEATWAVPRLRAYF